MVPSLVGTDERKKNLLIVNVSLGAVALYYVVLDHISWNFVWVFCSCYCFFLCVTALTSNL